MDIRRFGTTSRKRSLNTTEQGEASLQAAPKSQALHTELEFCQLQSDTRHFQTVKPTNHSLTLILNLAIGIFSILNLGEGVLVTGGGGGGNPRAPPL